MEKGVLQGVPSSMSGNIFIQNESVYSAGIDKFCSQENADQCLAFLNRVSCYIISFVDLMCSCA